MKRRVALAYDSEPSSCHGAIIVALRYLQAAEEVARTSTPLLAEQLVLAAVARLTAAYPKARTSDSLQSFMASGAR